MVNFSDETCISNQIKRSKTGSGDVSSSLRSDKLNWTRNDGYVLQNKTLTLPVNLLPLEFRRPRI